MYMDGELRIFHLQPEFFWREPAEWAYSHESCRRFPDMRIDWDIWSLLMLRRWSRSWVDLGVAEAISF